MRHHAFSLGLILYVAMVTLSGCQSASSSNKPFDPLDFYAKLTSIMTAYQPRLGQPTQYPGNQIQCSQFILDASDPVSYYGLKINAIDGYYDTYKAGSQFDKDTQKFATMLDSLMQLFSDSGFIDLIVERGQTPALMFDIDNTFAFTSNRDFDEIGNAPQITAVTDFVKKNCFVNGVDCYFVSARLCTENRALSSQKWLTDNLQLSEAQMEKYVVLMGTVSGCQVKSKNTRIAYKDVIRKALSGRDNVYWLMSVGDQLTDFFGRYSGMKAWAPNLLFQANVVPNQDYSTNPGTQESCPIINVIEPDDDCMAQLIDNEKDPGILHKTTVSYCAACKDLAGCF